MRLYHKIPGGRLAEVFGTKKVFGSTMVRYSYNHRYFCHICEGGGFNINTIIVNDKVESAQKYIFMFLGVL